MPSIPRSWVESIARVLKGDFGAKGESLRKDIEDELADHLACSLERERQHHPSDAEDRVLDRFGTPATVAARLWFDGMKGEIMVQRWIIGAVSLVACASLVTSAMLYWATISLGNRLQASVGKLDEHLAAAQSMDWVSAQIRLVKDEPNQPPVTGATVKLTGALISGDSIEITAVSDSNGRVTLGPFRPGVHALILQDLGPAKWYLSEKMTFHPGGSDEILIRCPRDDGKLHTVQPEIIDDGDPSALAGTLRRVLTLEGREFHASIGSYLFMGSGEIYLLDPKLREATSKARLQPFTLPDGPGEYRIKVFGSGNWNPEAGDLIDKKLVDLFLPNAYVYSEADFSAPLLTKHDMPTLQIDFSKRLQFTPGFGARTNSSAAGQKR